MNIAATVNQTLKALEPSLTKKFRQLALSAGWPATIVASLSVKSTNGSLAVDIPAYLEKEVNSLEYGEGNVPPAPVLRTFGQRIESELTNAVSLSAVQSVIDEGVF